MRRTRATDCRSLPFDPARCFAALVDVGQYPQWWPGELRVRVLKATPDYLGSRVEVRPFGSRFVCEIARVVSGREVEIQYVEGVHRGTGRWTVAAAADDSRLCYAVDLEPHGLLPRLLSGWVDFAAMHSRAMTRVFDGLETWLKKVEANP